MLLNMENEGGGGGVVGDQIMLQKTQAHPLYPVRLVFFVVVVVYFCVCVSFCLKKGKNIGMNTTLSNLCLTFISRTLHGYFKVTETRQDPIQLQLTVYAFIFSLTLGHFFASLSHCILHFVLVVFQGVLLDSFSVCPRCLRHRLLSPNTWPWHRLEWLVPPPFCHCKRQAGVNNYSEVPERLATNKKRQADAIKNFLGSQGPPSPAISENKH